MPQVIVYAVEGRNAAQKKALMKAITDAVVEHFDVTPPQVVVQIVEAAGDSKAKGGVPYNEL